MGCVYKEIRSILDIWKKPLQDGSIFTDTDYTLVVWSNSNPADVCTMSLANMSAVSFPIAPQLKKLK